MRCTLIGCVLLVLTASLAKAQDPERLESARATMLNAALNPETFAGRQVEALCHVIQADVDFIACGIHNKSKQPVGQTLIFMRGISPNSGAMILDNCSVGIIGGRHKAECILFLTISSDGYGTLIAHDATSVLGADD